MAGPQFFYGAMPILFRRSLRTSPALPKPICQCGDVPLAGFVSGGVDAVPGPGSLVLLLCMHVGLIGVLQRLPGTFMSGQMIFLSAVFGAGTMGMCGIATVLGSYLL